MSSSSTGDPALLLTGGSTSDVAGAATSSSSGGPPPSSSSSTPRGADARAAVGALASGGWGALVPPALLGHPLVVQALRRYHAALTAQDAEAEAQLAALRQAAAATRATVGGGEWGRVGGQP